MRIAKVAILLLVLRSESGVKSDLQQPVPAKAEIMQRTDWEVEFRDVFTPDLT